MDEEGEASPGGGARLKMKMKPSPHHPRVSGWREVGCQRQLPLCALPRDKGQLPFVSMSTEIGGILTGRLREGQLPPVFLLRATM